MPKRIFFCGEVVADLLEEKQESGEFKLFLGGSQFNGARGAKKAALREKVDLDVGFVGSLSKDLFGERFVSVLKEENIDISGIKRVDRNTTLAIVSIRPNKENEFSFYGRDTAEQMTKIEDLPTSLGEIEEDKIFYFGSISTVMEPARFAWLAFAAKQKETGLVMYDLNTRPSIAKDPKKYRELVLEWARISHVMKASDADIGWAYPDMNTEEVAKIWLEAGTTMVVLTKGTDGSEAYTKNMKAEVPTPALVTTNTVGAGDNFNAGLAVFLHKNDCATPQKIAALNETQLASILRGATHTAAHHLISIGAKLKEDNPIFAE
ncbi:MAG TPA: hypothetical protein DD400_05320 [Rhodospirillaceae bacterium]|nr:hypothetical protein [Rhodospirillaceae bacterium]